MMSWLRCVEEKLSLRRTLATVTLLGLVWIAIPVQAADRPAARRSAKTSVTNPPKSDSAPSEPIYTVTYSAADIISKIQEERQLNAEDAKEFLRNRVKGPPVLQKNFDQHQRDIRIENDPQWLEDNLVVIASRAGHEQVYAMLSAFRKFGVKEYAISVRFITMTEEQALEAFPDSTSSLLTSIQNPSTDLESAPVVSEIPPVYDGQPTVRARTIIEEDSTTRFRVIDKEALTKLIAAVHADRRTNDLEAPLVTTYNEQTASLSDTCRSQFTVGANLLPSGGHELKTKTVTEGTSMHFRPIAEANGDIRLDFAASFTKIDKVTKEVLKLTPDKETVLQIPQVATCQVDGGVVLKPGQSLMFGGIKRLSEGRSESTLDKLLGREPKREMQLLIVIMQVEPFHLPPSTPQQPPSVAKHD